MVLLQGSIGLWSMGVGSTSHYTKADLVPLLEVRGVMLLSIESRTTIKKKKF